MLLIFGSLLRKKGISKELFIFAETQLEKGLKKGRNFYEIIAVKLWTLRVCS